MTRCYFESGAGAGVLAGPLVGRGAAGSRAAGTWVQFDVAVASDPASGFDAGASAMCPKFRIAAARFLAYACPHTIAVAAWIVERAAGRPCVAALPVSVHDIAARFELPAWKLGRLLIVEDAWLAASRAASDPSLQGVTLS